MNKTLVYDQQLASDTAAFQSSQPLAGWYVIWATARPGADLKQVEAIVTEEIARLAKEGPTEEELSRAKTKWEFNFVTGLEGIGGFGGKADILNRYNTYLGKPGMFEADFARYRGATVASVKAVVNEYLNTRNRLLVRFRPEQSGAPSDHRGRSHQRAAARHRSAVHGARREVVQAAERHRGLRGRAAGAAEGLGCPRDARRGHRRPGRQGRARPA